MSTVITVTLTDCAADHGAVALIAPLGIDTEFQAFEGFLPPDGWGVEIVAEQRTGLRAAVMVPPSPDARGRVSHRFGTAPRRLDPAAFAPERCALTNAAAELAAHARSIAIADRDGRDGILLIVADTNARFTYGTVPYEERWYVGRDNVPAVACAAGNCIDINTYLVAALRAAGYDAMYLTCYYFPADEGMIAPGMHCWVRTRCEGVIDDWDIAHVKKVGGTDVRPALNPVPGQRFALSYGRSHAYPWRERDISISTPSEPMWVLPNGTTAWCDPPVVSQNSLA